ncbi:MAG: GUN4 domain-containing protein [Nodosilinea sp.]
MLTTTTQAWTLADLEELLRHEEWQAADTVTHALLAAASDGQGGGELTIPALAQLPCSTLHHLDRLWVEASQGHFGFSVQRHLYNRLCQGFDPGELNVFNPHPFLREVGWLMLAIPRPMAFCKFYNFLEFSLEAPRGHLPALWYWQVSWAESWRMGGFGTGRGGGFADLARLDALMLRLARCSKSAPELRE